MNQPKLLSAPRVFVFSLLLIFAGTTAATDTSSSQPLSQSLLQKSNAVETIQLPPLDVLDLQTKSAENMQMGSPVKFAETHIMSLAPKSQGKWEVVNSTQGSESIWRMRLLSPNGKSINLGFTKYKMPHGGRMFLYADGYTQLRGPFTDLNNKAHGEFWSPIIKGQAVTIELNIPTDKVDELELELNHANQAFVGFENARRDLSLIKSGSCNVDVACSQANDWRDQVRSVGAYSIFGTFACSGAAINNTARNGRPYFLTAEHCTVSPANDQSVVIYWNYENSSCRPIGSAASGANGDGSLATFNSGTRVVAESTNTDFQLLELEDAFNPAANVFLAGWSRSDTIPSSAVSIHHPGVEEKRISFENDALLETGPGFDFISSGYLRVIDWDLGTTEGGSSGSPLFDPNKRIVGQLFGGLAACGNNSSDWYGFLARSWGGGGLAGPTDRLSDWLDEAETNSVTLNGMNAIAQDQYENDDTHPFAKPIVAGERQSRTIHVPDNDDYASFTLTETTAVELAVLGMPAGTLLNLILRGTNGTSLLNAQLGTNPSYSEPPLTPGTYFIHINPRDEGGPTNYSLLFNELKADAFENDDSSVTAGMIDLDQAQQHSIYPAGDEDWAKITITEKGSYVFATRGVIGSTQIEVYDDDLNLQKSGGVFGQGRFGRVTVQLDPGDYFVKVAGFGSNTVANYELKISIDDDFLLQVIPAIIKAATSTN